MAVIQVSNYYHTVHSQRRGYIKRKRRGQIKNKRKIKAMYLGATNKTSNVLLSILLFSAAVATASCTKSGPPSSNSPGSTSSTPSTAGGDFEGTIAMRVEGENQKGAEMTYFLKGKHTRIETRMGDHPEASAAMLWDLEAGKITTLMPSQKVYMTMDLKAAAEGFKEMKKSHGQEENEFPKLTPTGKQETIAGHTCEHWLMGENQDLDLCVAKGLGYFGMGGQSGGGLGSWKNLMFSPEMLAKAAAHPEWVKFLEGGAFPLKFSAMADGKIKMSMEATRIEKKTLDDSLFAIPPDYKEMSIPSVPGLPAGKQ